jgi:hypothetical protein
MLMGNRDLGAHDERKSFTDKLGPVKPWLDSQVGPDWDKVYSEIRQAFPNTDNFWARPLWPATGLPASSSTGGKSSSVLGSLV